MRFVARALLSSIFVVVAANVAQPQQTADARLDPENTRIEAALVDSARAEKLPFKALTGVLQEGLSRHADGPRIVRAMQDYLRALRAASTALGAASAEGEIVSGAGAVLAGVTPAMLAQIRAARGSTSIVVPLVVLGDLVARGVPVRSAGAAVTSAAKGGLRDADFMALRQRVEQDIASGAPAAAALESGMRRLRNPDLQKPDTVLRRGVKTPPGFDDAHLDIGEVAGTSRGFTDIRGAADFLFGDRSPIGISSALRVVPVTSGVPDMLFQGTIGARTGDQRAGASVNAGVRSAHAAALGWTAPLALARTWRQAGPYALSLDFSLSSLSANAASSALALSSLTGLSSVRMSAADTQPTFPLPPTSPPTSPSSTPSPTDSSAKATTARSLTFAETQFSVFRQFAGLDVLGVAGVRMSNWRGLTGWSSLTVTKPVVNGVGLLARAAVGQEDMISPLHQLRFFAGLRLQVKRPAPLLAAQEANSSVESVLSFRTIPVDSVTLFEVRAPLALSVEIAGDFTDWKPLALMPSSTSVWRVSRPVESGVYRIRLRIDGGLWTAPPGMPRAPDLFGGETGLLTVLVR